MKNNFYNFKPKKIPKKFAEAKITGISTLYGDMGFVHVDTNKGLFTISFNIKNGEI